MCENFILINHILSSTYEKQDFGVSKNSISYRLAILCEFNTDHYKLCIVACSSVETQAVDLMQHIHHVRAISSGEK